MIKRLKKIITKPVQQVYYYLLWLLLISNFTVLVYDKGNFTPLYILAFSVFMAYIFASIYENISNKWFSRSFLVIVVTLTNILCTVDYFLLLNFHTIICQNVVDILGETNPNEISEFVSTYLSPMRIFVYVAVVIMLNSLLWYLAKFLVQVHSLLYVNLPLLLFGTVLCIYTCVSFALYKNGMGMPQRTAFSRVAYSCYTTFQRSKSISHLNELCKTVKVYPSTPPPI